MTARQFSTVLGLSALLAALYVAAPGGAAAAGSTCVPATNIEAILDDSGSMGSNDYNANRAEALKILISKSGNAKKTLGALEFGSEDTYATPPLPGATTLFAPQPIYAGAAAMKAALDANLKADHGTTDYNAAFALAKTDNPAANARIFITDGGHNSGIYADGHLGGPPTYVLGMGIGAASATDEDATRLQKIADDTGGSYYPNVNDGNINSTMNVVDAALNCQAVSKTFTDQFSKAGQSKAKSLVVASSTRSLDLVLTWRDPLDAFTIGSISLKLKSGGSISIAKRHLKIKRTGGKTFVNVHVSKLKRGKLKFKLRAVKLGNPLSGATLTTQATQSRRR